jgi:predicted neutral ceramidase superfamily lipid hydrolase
LERAAMSMAFFNDYSYFVLFYTLAAPALPWLFARNRGAAALRRAAWITVVLLVVFNASLWLVCDAVGCGQGAIGILALSVIAVFSGCITWAVTALLVRSRQ